MPAMVVIPTIGRGRRVLVDQVHSIVCHRNRNEEEQFLVCWKTGSSTQTPPLSWHSVGELGRCLEFVQDYLDNKARLLMPALALLSKKRKTPDSDTELELRPSPIDRRFNSSSRTPSTERSPSVWSASLAIPGRSNVTASSPSPSIDVYNGVLDSKNGFIVANIASGPDIPEINIQNVPTPEMAHAARRAKTTIAETLIRAAYHRRLDRVIGKKIFLVNTIDSSTPSLRFRYIPEHVLCDGVFRVSPEAQEGCDKCSPHMGRGIGCEYTKKCRCLEYAAVDEARMDDEQKELYTRIKGGYEATTDELLSLPKRFPYYAEGAKRQRAGCLVPFYLNSRRPIYECNDNCKCGPNCRNKNVQFGRTVELEIFKTASSRGWGLRCRQKLYEGQFIDTYRGEIITDAEATRREEATSSKDKASYLYSLDKFKESEGLEDEDIYVVDGEYMGGPTKFMNHSCEPNCRQYTVSYNKHDPKVYDLAFFACRDIEKGEELTFDYLDKDEGEEMDEPGDDAIPCLCGAKKCRKWLWT
ncbi:SET domain-containing protein [Lindgomyces ingoldianus]|uniref:SET domain-containing protein n=1 Tax=Lindgomyces ingoldianus TaxID=673940 RepID=A0ACB6R075_9PLEO|nr:SET domain-containing protein [Lindgomyces ingoldianus]KAF2472195.1 SET domain-containing protein [Lindgomyces ingoldianus]